MQFYAICIHASWNLYVEIESQDLCMLCSEECVNVRNDLLGKHKRCSKYILAVNH